MSENSKESNLKSTAEAVKAIVDSVPVYQDVVQPAAKQVGESLTIVAKSVHMALSPLRAVVWGWEKIEDFIVSSVAQKLSKVSVDKIISPAPQIAGPTVESLRFAGHEPNLRDLYANLLATAMNKDTVQFAHPGYVEIIKNLTPDEAFLMKQFLEGSSYAIINVNVVKEQGGFVTIFKNVSLFEKFDGVVCPEMVPSYIDNLCRLGLLYIPPGLYLNDELAYGAFDKIERINKLDEALKTNPEDKRTIEIERRILRLTEFGENFVLNIVKDK